MGCFGIQHGYGLQPAGGLSEIEVCLFRDSRILVIFM